MEKRERRRSRVSPSESLKGWWPWHPGFLETGAPAGVHCVRALHRPRTEIFFVVREAALSHPVALPRSVALLSLELHLNVNLSLSLRLRLKRHLVLLPPQMFRSLNIFPAAGSEARSRHPATGIHPHTLRYRYVFKNNNNNTEKQLIRGS